LKWLSSLLDDDADLEADGCEASSVEAEAALGVVTSRFFCARPSDHRFAKGDVEMKRRFGMEAATISPFKSSHRFPFGMVQ